MARGSNRAQKGKYTYLQIRDIEHVISWLDNSNETSLKTLDVKL